jgi:NADPH-dependent 2,4-dienoyl-CoA reductase/sulfur reductase-like enzyme
MADATHTPDVLVIGAGPAGVAAACAAAAAGLSVTVFDDNPAPGGQIWRGGRRLAPSGPAAVWLDRLAASDAVVRPGTAVVDLMAEHGGRTIVTRSAAGIERWRPAGIVLATGARERFVPFPGWTLPGVVGAGGLQALVKQGLAVAGRRVVVAGSGPLLLAVAELLVRKGAVVAAVVEQAPLGRLAAFGAGLVLHPHKLAQAIGIRRTIGGVLRAGCFPERVRQEGDGLCVSLVSGPPGRERRDELHCDILACGFGLVPNVEVARALGCRIERGAVAVDDLGRTDVPGVWAAGECTGVGGVDAALVEGQIAGHAAADRADKARRLVPERRAAARFAATLESTFALDPRLAQLAADDTLVCRCEDVAAGRLRCLNGWREAKLLTRIGMGPCQGRVCGPAAETLFGWSPADVRPPFFPVPLGDVS